MVCSANDVSTIEGYRFALKAVPHWASHSGASLRAGGFLRGFLYPYCSLQVSKCSCQSCAVGAMSNLANMRPDMTSRTRSYLTNQRSQRLDIFRISGERLEMQLYKKISSLSQMVWCPAKKNHLEWWQHRTPPPPPGASEG